MAANILEASYKFILSVQGHTCEIRNKSRSISASVKMAVVNRHRNLTAVEDISYEGETFIVYKKDLDAAGYGVPKRGDVIISTLTGNHSIADVKEDIVFGNTIGYKLWCS